MLLISPQQLETLTGGHQVLVNVGSDPWFTAGEQMWLSEHLSFQLIQLVHKVDLKGNFTYFTHLGKYYCTCDNKLYVFCGVGGSRVR